MSQNFSNIIDCIDHTCAHYRIKFHDRRYNNYTEITATSVMYVIVLINVVYQLIQSKSKARKIAELEETIKDLQERGAESGPPVNVQSTSQQLDPNSPAYGGLIPPRDTPGGSQYDIARDSSNKSSQTLETAFVPCESCERVQQNLREVGDMVINVCETQSLPSSLSKFKHQVIGIDWFTANDVNRWTTEQNKDLKKINKHLEQLMSTIDPMKKDISSLTKKCEKLQQKLDQCDREMDLEKQTQKAQQKQYEQKIKDIEKENSEAVGAVERKNDELIMHKQELEANLDNMKQELQRQEQQLRELGMRFLSLNLTCNVKEIFKCEIKFYSVICITWGEKLIIHTAIIYVSYFEVRFFSTFH